MTMAPVNVKSLDEPKMNAMKHHPLYTPVPFRNRYPFQKLDHFFELKLTLTNQKV